ncbi:hypothetical protein MKZ38_006517 [Zalerion maritima]|uniref:Uncharacterized protein n=1 Tax=Zalerion maritima TaxID=339359 RepID=A0AAD5RZW5_9PEZI|nr:hypothetical protein MKZ38_006517 [Zalerion maritima]
MTTTILKELLGASNDHIPNDDKETEAAPRRNQVDGPGSNSRQHNDPPSHWREDISPTEQDQKIIVIALSTGRDWVKQTKTVVEITTGAEANGGVEIGAEVNVHEKAHMKGESGVDGLVYLQVVEDVYTRYGVRRAPHLSLFFYLASWVANNDRTAVWAGVSTLWTVG